MADFTKLAAQVFAPTSGGSPRGADMQECADWGTVVESKLQDIETQIPSIIDPLSEAFLTTMDIVTAMGSDLPAGRHIEVYKVVKTLYGLGAYDSDTGLDAFYMLRAHSLQAACVNWIDPTTHTLTPINDPWFYPDVGVQGDNAASYFRGPHVDNLQKYSLNSASMGIGIGESQYDDSDIDCGFDGNDVSYISAHNLNHGGAIRSRANYFSSETSGTMFNTPIGLTMWSRRSGSAYDVAAVRDVSYFGTEGQTQALTMAEGYFCIGRGGTSGGSGSAQYSGNLYVCAFVGGGLSLSTESRDALYAAIFGA